MSQNNNSRTTRGKANVISQKTVRNEQESI